MYYAPIHISFVVYCACIIKMTKAEHEQAQQSEETGEHPKEIGQDVNVGAVDLLSLLDSGSRAAEPAKQYSVDKNQATSKSPSNHVD